MVVGVGGCWCCVVVGVGGCWCWCLLVLVVVGVC